MPLSLVTLALVAFGGALGAVARLGATALAARLAGAGFPWGTLSVNVVGSLAMGVAAGLLLERAGDLSHRAAPFLMTGVLGGFTTFSAFSLDALTLIERGRTAAALAYAGGSVALSLLALWAGISAVRFVMA
jgi:CrcB protein